MYSIGGNILINIHAHIVNARDEGDCGIGKEHRGSRRIGKKGGGKRSGQRGIEQERRMERVIGFQSSLLAYELIVIDVAIDEHYY